MTSRKDLEHGYVSKGRYYDGGPSARRAARRMMFFTVLAAIAIVVVGGFFLNEMYRKEVSDVVREVKKVMYERDSVCLSSIHVGRDEYKVVLLAPTKKGFAGSGVTMMDPTIYQAFGNNVKTQELANPPLKCYHGRTKAYTIHRTRKESVTVSFTPVNTSDSLWLIKNAFATKKTMMTFSGAESYCLQHILEVFAQRNPCDELTDVEQRYDRRVDL
jgi:hypothetical protein